MEDSVHTLFVYDIDDPPSLDPEKLTQAHEALDVHTAHSVSDAIDRLSTETFDCVLSEYELPDEDGVTFLRHIRDINPDLPFILHPRDGSERIASDAIAAGVTDYIRNEPDSDQTEVVATRITDAVNDTPTDTGARVRELTEATDVVLWLMSADWEELLFVNSAYSRMWGQDEADLREDPSSFLDAIHPDDREKAREAVSRVSAGESTEVEFRVNPTEDFGRRVFIQAEPIFDCDGSVKRIAGASREVTEHRERERRLEEEKQMVDSIFAALPDVLYTFNKQAKLLRWNDRLEEETGYTSSEIEEMIMTDFVPADEIEPILESFQTIMQERREVTIESAFETKSGERIPFEFTGAPLMDSDDTLRGFTGMGRNISGRKERQRRFEAVFNNTYQFTGLLLPDGTLIEVNQTAIEFAGSERDELVGEKFWDASWFQANEEVQQMTRDAVQTARGGEFFREQITVQGGDREAVIDFSLRPVTDENGDVELLIYEGRDITRLSERERQLEVTNRFLRHNIRNKLTVIHGYGELVSQADDDRLRSYGTSITKASTELHETAEMARNIHELIAGDPSPKPVDIVEQIEQAVSTTRDRYPDATIVVDTPDSLEARSLMSLHRALAELLKAMLTNATLHQPTVRIDITQDEMVTVEFTAVDGRLSPVEQEVLTGDIEIKQIRHAQGLGVWYFYWHIWYSGGTVSVTEPDGDIVISLPLAS